MKNNINNVQKENLRLFLRFLKNENAFGRFLYCKFHIGEGAGFTIDNFLNHLENKCVLVNLVPFPWSSIENSCNYTRYWKKLNDIWVSSLGKT